MNGNLLTRILAAIVTAAALVVSFIVGTVVAMVALGLVFIGWIAFAIRTRQIRRAFRKQQAEGGGSDVIEGEYRVVHRREDYRDE